MKQEKELNKLTGKLVELIDEEKSKAWFNCFNRFKDLINTIDQTEQITDKERWEILKTGLKTIIGENERTTD